MPVKKDTKSAKGKSSAVVSGPSKEDRSNKELNQQIIRLQEDLDRVRKERRDIQFEIDSLHASWANTKRQLEEKKAEVKNKQIEMKEVVKKQLHEIRVCKQKVQSMRQEQASTAALQTKGAAAEKHQTDTRVYKQKVKDFLYLQHNSTEASKTKQVGETKILGEKLPVVENIYTRMVPPTKTLLKYENPERVSKNTEKRSPKTRPLKVSPQLPAIHNPVPPSHKRKSPSSDATKQTLNAILPPRQSMKNNQLHLQQVSSMPCTRTEVIHLQEELDLQLKERHARVKGICPVRRELYTQCFDELIRQVTIDCAERGLLLSRVRDEILMSIAAYQTQSECGVAFGVEKALQAKQGKLDVEKRIADLENETRELERQFNEQQAKRESIERQQDEQRQMVEKNHAKEISFLRLLNKQLQDQLFHVTARNK